MENIDLLKKELRISVKVHTNVGHVEEII